MCAADPAAPTPAAPARPIAIFVYNHADPALADKVGMFRDLLASSLTDAGFSILSRDTSETALASATQGGPPTPADQLLSQQSSATRLAQNLGADYVLVSSLASYAMTDKSFAGYGVAFNNRFATLRVASVLYDANSGGSLISYTATEKEGVGQTVNLTQIDPDIVNRLFADAAADTATYYLQKVAQTPLPAATAPSLVDYSVVCSMGDLVLPDILHTADGQYVVGPLDYTVQPLDVTVELNGAAVGSAPGNFTGPAGLSKLRLSRDGFTPWEHVVNLSPGFVLKVSLLMDDQGYARWQQSIAFLQSLKTNAKLTDAEVQRVLGIAQMFRQSGLRFDQRSDINVNATQFPTVQQVNQSLFAVPPPPTSIPEIQR
jgi:hypothetical protein